MGYILGSSTQLDFYNTNMVSLDTRNLSSVTTDCSTFTTQQENTQISNASSGRSTNILIGDGPWFTIIHVSGITSLGFSIMFSSYLICHVFGAIRRGRKSFWQLKLPERFVVYLAICDLLWSCSHLVDHIIMLATHDNVPDPYCAILGALLSQFLIGQALVVWFISVNAMLLVLRERGVMDLGRYDWKVLSIAVFIPLIWGIVLFCLDLFGPSGAWCFLDARRDDAVYAAFNNTYSLTMIIMLLVNMVSYTVVTCKVRRADVINNRSATYGKRASVHKIAATSARIILAYFAQWWPWFLYAPWSFFEKFPHVSLVVLTTIFCNLGGVFNFFAYRTFRKTLNMRPSVKSVSNGETSANATQ